MIHIKNLSVGYASKEVLNGLNLELQAGELTALLGRNGSGKSTLIRSISGVQKPLSGHAELNGRSIEDIPQRALAKELSLVLTNNQAPGNLTVYALVSLGRFPYTSWMGTLSDKDKKVIEWALEVTGTLQFANIHIGELSDGEKQKVMIARALAQETDIIILDEPTAHLDTPNRLEIFHLLKELVAISNRAILISTHDIDTALHYADRLWLVEGTSVKSGVPEDLVIDGSLEKAFEKDQLQFDYSKGIFKKTEASLRKEVAVEGDETLIFWLKNALERNGYEISPNAKLKIKTAGELTSPNFQIEGRNNTYKTIEQLLIQLKNEEN